METKEEQQLVEDINRRYKEQKDFKKNNPKLCNCSLCQVGDFILEDS